MNLWRRGAVALFIIALLLCAQPRLQALPPMLRHVEGTIISADLRNRTVVLRPDIGPSLRLVWTSRTRFVRGAQFVSAANVVPGARVQAWKRAPLFSPAFVTRIIFERKSGSRSAPPAGVKSKETL